VGRTGLAGDRHLHFSLHRGAGTVAGTDDSLPMDRIVTRAMDSGRGFEMLNSLDFDCSAKDSPWSGSLYGSENDGAPEVVRGNVTGSLATLLDDMHARVGEAVQRRRGLWIFAENWMLIAPDAAREHLSPWLRAAPEDPVARYYWVTEVEIPKGQYRKARASLLQVMVQATETGFYEPWLIPWAHNRLGSIELALGRREVAVQHFRRAGELMPSHAVRRYGELELQRADAVR
jgi:hypothetical protein